MSDGIDERELVHVGTRGLSPEDVHAAMQKQIAECIRQGIIHAQAHVFEEMHASINNFFELHTENQQVAGSQLEEALTAIGSSLDARATEIARIHAESQATELHLGIVQMQHGLVEANNMRQDALQHVRLCAEERVSSEHRLEMRLNQALADMQALVQARMMQAAQQEKELETRIDKAFADLLTIMDARATASARTQVEVQAFEWHRGVDERVQRAVAEARTTSTSDVVIRQSTERRLEARMNEGFADLRATMNATAAASARAQVEAQVGDLHRAVEERVRLAVAAVEALVATTTDVAERGCICSEKQATSERRLEARIDERFAELRATIDARASATARAQVDAQAVELHTGIEERVRVAVADARAAVTQGAVAHGAEDRVAFEMRLQARVFETEKRLEVRMDEALAELRATIDARASATARAQVDAQAVELHIGVEERVQLAVAEARTTARQDAGAHKSACAAERASTERRLQAQMNEGFAELRATIDARAKAIAPAQVDVKHNKMHIGVDERVRLGVTEASTASVTPDVRVEAADRASAESRLEALMDEGFAELRAAFDARASATAHAQDDAKATKLQIGVDERVRTAVAGARTAKASDVGVRTEERASEKRLQELMDEALADMRAAEDRESSGKKRESRPNAAHTQEIKAPMNARVSSRVTAAQAETQRDQQQRRFQEQRRHESGGKGSVAAAQAEAQRVQQRRVEERRRQLLQYHSERGGKSSVAAARAEAQREQQRRVDERRRSTSEDKGSVAAAQAEAQRAQQMRVRHRVEQLSRSAPTKRK